MLWLFTTCSVFIKNVRPFKIRYFKSLRAEIKEKVSRKPLKRKIFGWKSSYLTKIWTNIMNFCTNEKKSFGEKNWDWKNRIQQSCCKYAVKKFGLGFDFTQFFSQIVFVSKTANLLH